MSLKKSWVTALSILILALSIFTFFKPIKSVSADSITFQTKEELLYVTVDDILRNEDEQLLELTYRDYVLLDLEFQEIGTLYELACVTENRNTEGYAIMLNDSGYWDVYEIAIGRTSPFDGHEGLYIYAGSEQYVLVNDEGYFLLNGYGCEWIENIEEIPTGYGFSSTDKPPTTVYYSVAFDRYNYTSKSISGFHANYDMNVAKKENNCSNAAGVVLLNHFNKKLNNAIFGTEYVYDGANLKNDLDNSGHVMNDLYVKMRTNNWGLWGLLGNPGTSPANFKRGIEDYLSSRGYKPIYNGVGTLNFSKFKTQIDKGNPVVIHATTKYELYKTLPTSSGTSVKGEKRVIPHCMIAYGYMIRDYYRQIGTTSATELFRTDNFLIVADSWGGIKYLRQKGTAFGTSFGVEVVKK